MLANEKRRPGEGGAGLSLAASSPALHASNASVAQRKTLFLRPRGDAVEMLRLASIAFSDGDLVAAQRFHERMVAAREQWLRLHGRGLFREARHG